MEHIHKAVTSGQGMVTIEALRQVGSPAPATPLQGSAPSEETAHPPQSVGREFVRQYYTMLHRAPEQLHRFYSQNSSFLHEHWRGFRYEERPAIGQIEIYDRIKEMNFRDCHAKIFQVDSQLSVCQTVVVQVLGELSNNGEPLRKFMQTFVLVPQTNKKYYVHNDIFRYQDDDLDLDFGLQQQHSQPVEQECNNGEVVLEEFNQQLVYVGQVEETSTAAVRGTEAAVLVAAVPVAADASNDLNRAAESAGDELVAVNELKEAPISDMVEQDETASSPEVVAVVSQAAEVASSDLNQDIEEVSSSKPVVEKNQLPATSEIKEMATPPQKLSWAEMASRNVGSTFKPLAAKVEQKNGGSPIVVPVSQAEYVNSVGALPPNAAKNSPPPTAGNQYVATKTPVFRGDNNYQQQQQQQHGNVVVDDTGSNSGKSMQYYPDQQQIFVGNLPHHMSDQDLKEFFEKYGRVLDIRINRKPNNNLPNFGFIAFDCAETVKYILSLRPLYNGRFRVNVEEKKRREDLIGCRPRSGQHSMANQNQNGVTNGNEQPHREEMSLEQKVSGC